MAVTVSAPGKVLMTGGYLILERPNAGIVLGTTARFYAIVKPLYDAVKPESWVWAWTDVRVTSPQLYRETSYKLSLNKSILQNVSSRDLSNPFVEQALQYAIATALIMHRGEGERDALHKRLLQGLDITILGSNDFYSYREQIEALGLPLTTEALASLPLFSPITFNSNESNRADNRKKCKPEVAKTGLGSSAAMTTAVVGAVLHYLGVVNLPISTEGEQVAKVNSSDLDLIHIVAQSAHCVAQGKVGSGFDVSAAVYGSQRFIRFSPEILSSAQVEANRRLLQATVAGVLEGKWDYEKVHFSLPPLMTLMLGEPGTGGSSTPSMVGSVKQWQRSDPQRSQEICKNLGKANSKLEIQLRMLHKLAEQWETYKFVVDSCSSLHYEKWMSIVKNQCHEAVVKSLLGARDAMLEIRSLLRLMGEAAGVPIEPESQTRLLDATMNMEGVLLAGVPGAGGFDAVFAVTLGNSNYNLMQSWSSLDVLPMLVREDARGVSLESGDPRTKEISSGISSIQFK